MRMVSAIDVNWVAPLLPKLKDEVDVDRLSGRIKISKEEENKHIETTTILGKRKAEIGSDKLQAANDMTQSSCKPLGEITLTKDEKLA